MPIIEPTQPFVFHKQTDIEIVVLYVQVYDDAPMVMRDFSRPSLVQAPLGDSTVQRTQGVLRNLLLNDGNGFQPSLATTVGLHSGGKNTAAIVKSNGYSKTTLKPTTTRNYQRPTGLIKLIYLHNY